MSEGIALASFYGGIWPTLVQNIVVYWMIFVGVVMGWGKNGLFTNKTKRRRPITVEGCSSCQDHYYEQDEKHSVSPIQYDSSTTLNEVTLTQEEKQRVNGHSSSSSTFDININVKTRKRGMKI
ncbi:hypothetical protein BDB01DRAFT_849275 [Pilobolus umbonatus]|nr:hypothetical protein BDB01DRAFT_849275 [Pilobolus umbonatus]